MVNNESYKTAIRHLLRIHFMGWNFIGTPYDIGYNRTRGYVQTTENENPVYTFFDKIHYIIVKPDGDIIINAWWDTRKDPAWL